MLTQSPARFECWPGTQGERTYSFSGGSKNRLVEPERQRGRYNLAGALGSDINPSNMSSVDCVFHHRFGNAPNRRIVKPPCQSCQADSAGAVNGGPQKAEAHFAVRRLAHVDAAQAD